MFPPRRANGWREDIVIINAFGATRQRVRIIERQLSTPVTDRQALGLVRGPAGAGVGGEWERDSGRDPVHDASAHARYLG
jgi:hypothetical protein